MCKTLFGTFMAASSDLHKRLVAGEIHTLILREVAMNCSVELTACESMASYRCTFVVSDASATDADGEHNAALSYATQRLRRRA